MSQVVVQKLNKREASEIKLAARYFQLISAATNIHLTRTEVNLLAFTAIRGTITSLSAREEFLATFGVHRFTMEKLKVGLTRKGFMIKEGDKYKISPRWGLNFDLPIILQIKIEVTNGGAKNGEDTGR